MGKGKFSCVLALERDAIFNADDIRQALSIHDEIVHISIEINKISAVSRGTVLAK